MGLKKEYRTRVYSITGKRGKGRTRTTRRIDPKKPASRQMRAWCKKKKES